MTTTHQHSLPEPAIGERNSALREDLPLETERVRSYNSPVITPTSVTLPYRD